MLAIDEDDLAVNLLHELAGLFGKFRGGDENTLAGASALQGAGEFLHLRPTDRSIPPLGLDVNDVETEPVLLDDAVDPLVSRAAEGLPLLPPFAPAAET